ncbi:MAG TPA: glycosyltransferase [Ferruginibacter sp.]|nr:glycosyltransferase [Ferruginibacter sp.]
MLPEISVILPVYNGEKYLALAIESVLSQTFSNFEFIIIDDASTDNTKAIIQSYKDDRIIYIRNDTNLKITGTLNKGIQLSRGKYIARMDADDICLPTRFEKQVDYLDQHLNVAVVDCIMQYIDENGTYLNKINSEVKTFAEIKRTIPWTNCLGHSSVMYRTEIINKFNYRDITYEDLDLWYRLINSGYIIERLQLPLIWYRIHTSSLTGIQNKQNTHFKNLFKTKIFYLRSLGFIEIFNLFNITIKIGVTKDWLLWKYKMFKSYFSSL